jgi:hypothetical protein
MDTDLMGAIQKTKVTYYMCDSDYNLMTALGLSVPPQYLNVDGVTVSGRTITCEDYFFPLSIVEVGLGNQWNDDVAGNKVLALYDGATNKDRIKYFGTTARYWWLRSTHPWYCHSAAVVLPDGSLHRPQCLLFRRGRSRLFDWINNPLIQAPFAFSDGVRTMEGICQYRKVKEKRRS